MWEGGGGGNRGSFNNSFLRLLYRGLPGLGLLVGFWKGSFPGSIKAALEILSHLGLGFKPHLVLTFLKRG